MASPYHRGCLLAEEGDYRAAVADLTVALRRQPRWAALYFYRGTCYYWLNELERALVDLTAAIHFVSQPQAVFYLHRGST
uniref:Uncharacterized protein n=1 Tax=Thermogemmatispora argillosa TaxID=2045280 RepID=A0A455T1Z6_9CHLR|nr:hypothetical protein KTA_15780 [Thermogemmatispora argillosa]